MSLLHDLSYQLQSSERNRRKLTVQSIQSWSGAIRLRRAARASGCRDYDSSSVSTPIPNRGSKKQIDLHCQARKQPSLEEGSKWRTVQFHAKTEQLHCKKLTNTEPATTKRGWLAKNNNSTKNRTTAYIYLFIIDLTLFQKCEILFFF